MDRKNKGLVETTGLTASSDSVDLKQKPLVILAEGWIGRIKR